MVVRCVLKGVYVGVLFALRVERFVYALAFVSSCVRMVCICCVLFVIMLCRACMCFACVCGVL